MIQKDSLKEEAGTSLTKEMLLRKRWMMMRTLKMRIPKCLEDPTGRKMKKAKKLTTMMVMANLTRTNLKAKIGPIWNVRLPKMTKIWMMNHEEVVEAAIIKATIVARAVLNTSLQ